MKVRLLADENTSRRFVAAGLSIEADFPILHLADWKGGAYLSVKDPFPLMALREAEMVIVGFDRATLPMHAKNRARYGRSIGLQPDDGRGLESASPSAAPWRRSPAS